MSFKARMMASKFTPPRPSERKSQPRRGSPKFKWLARIPLRAVERDQGVLHVDVVDPIGKRADELGRIDPLPDQVAGIEVEAELGAVVQRGQRPLGGVDVEGDFRGMDFQGELHVALGKHVEDRVEPLGQQLEAGVDHGRRDGRERVEQVPDARTGEAVDDVQPQLLGRPGGVFQFFGGPGAHAGRVAVAPDVRRQDRLVPRDRPDPEWPGRPGGC